MGADKGKGIVLTDLIVTLNAFSPEAMLALEFLVYALAMMIVLRVFGAAGMIVYIAIGVVAANVQVLKAVQFSVFASPVALGTVLFSSTYVATDILTEFYGRATARQAVKLGFAAMLMMSIFMIMALGFRPMTPQEAGESMAWALPNHDRIMALFLPAPMLLVAGLSAYLVSQLLDIWIFQKIRGVTGSRLLWLRASGSTMISALVDNIVFSSLAWWILPTLLGQTDQVVALDALVFTFILGTYGIRLVMAIAEAPLVYIARRCLPTADRVAYEQSLSATGPD